MSSNFFFRYLMIQPTYFQWAAAMSLRTVMLSLQALMASPEPNDPQDAVVARQFSDNPVSKPLGMEL